MNAHFNISDFWLEESLKHLTKIYTTLGIKDTLVAIVLNALEDAIIRQLIMTKEDKTKLIELINSAYEQLSKPYNKPKE